MYRFERSLIIPVSLREAWHFFSKPSNLQQLMPDDMSFEILDDLPLEMYEGLLLRYKVAPLFNIPLNWTSRIEFIVKEKSFVDVQVEGPFQYWHHEHRFKSVPGGTRITDLLFYKLPLEPISKLFHRRIVKNKLIRIFTERERKSKLIFGSLSS